MKTILVIALGVMVSFPALAIADPATVAAALKDEAAECRYLLTFCRQGALQSIGDVFHVMQAKNGHEPTCMKECTRLLDELTAHLKGQVEHKP